SCIFLGAANRVELCRCLSWFCCMPFLFSSLSLLYYSSSVHALILLQLLLHWVTGRRWVGATFTALFAALLGVSCLFLIRLMRKSVSWVCSGLGDGMVEYILGSWFFGDNFGVGLGGLGGILATIIVCR